MKRSGISDVDALGSAMLDGYRMEAARDCVPWRRRFVGGR